MTKLEDFKTNEIEFIIDLIDYQIRTNDELLKDICRINLDIKDLEEVKKEQALLKSIKRKIEKIKGKVLFAYD